MAIDLLSVFDFIQKGGLLAGAFFIGWAGYKGVWRWGKECEAEEARHRHEIELLTKERDEYRNAAFRGTELAEFFKDKV